MISYHVLYIFGIVIFETGNSIFSPKVSIIYDVCEKIFRDKVSFLS